MRLFLSFALAGLASAAQAQGAPTTVPVPILNRAVEKGEILAASDFDIEERTASQARGAILAERAAGLEATRRLQPGFPVRGTDLMRAQLVRRGEPVALTVRSGGLLITAQGRALTGGGAGEIVRVVSTATNRTLEGTVEKTGQVRITAP